MKRAYITRAILKDYLTIKNVDVTFKSDINIIIGKNGTGKTNFINYLSDSINTLSSVNNNNSSIYFIFQNKHFLKISQISTVVNEDSNVDEIRDVKFFEDDIQIDGQLQSVALKSIKIHHGLPKKYYVAQEPLSDSIKKGEQGYFIFPNFQDNIIAFNIGFGYMRNVLINGAESTLYNINSVLGILNDNLNKYSNIQKVRIGENFKLSKSSPEETYFNNIYLEYLINDEWLSFGQISDGTKRLFYIISEITFNYRSIILLEEPELGLHPHQLHSLMQFIKEASEKFQFIITTHSPMVLNTLNSDKLGNIIISKFENGETKLEHLTSEQIEKAKVFMEEKSDLSDYWIHSDLED